MAESKSWAVIEALAAQLATITIANGYLTDVGQNVWMTDHQRPSDEALGLMLYSESIVGTGLDHERPTKTVRDFTVLIEAAIGTALDDAQQQIHRVIEDVECCIERFAKTTPRLPKQTTPMVLADIAILDRPEGAAVVAMQARVVGRYLR
jgi:hypothetical protein